MPLALLFASKLQKKATLLFHKSRSPSFLLSASRATQVLYHRKKAKREDTAVLGPEVGVRQMEKGRKLLSLRRAHLSIRTRSKCIMCMRAMTRMTHTEDYEIWISSSMNHHTQAQFHHAVIACCVSTRKIWRSNCYLHCIVFVSQLTILRDLTNANVQSAILRTMRANK